MVLLIEQRRHEIGAYSTSNELRGIDLLRTVAWALGGAPDAEWVLVHTEGEEWHATTFAIHEGREAAAAWSAMARENVWATLVAVPAMPDLRDVG